jgi:hypothetical protein
MKSITWFDFLCAFALLFSACKSAVRTTEVPVGPDLIEGTVPTTLTRTSSPTVPLPTRTLDFYRPDTVRETYAAKQATEDAAIATEWASGPTSTPRPKSTSIPSSTPIPTTDPEATFSGVGPWLVYGKSTGDEGFFAANANGSGRKLVNIPEDYPGRVAFSPSGFQMAYNTYASEVIDQTLVVARFPDGKILAEIPLFAQNWSALYGDQPGWLETDRAVGQAKWSPGGRYLAFVGALHGPSSDLYVFDLSTKEVRRLTDGPYQVLIMDWSPDGEWVVHQSIMSFGTGAGMAGEAVWAAALDGSEVRHLYDAPRQQILADWVDPFRFVVYEWGVAYGLMNILRVSIKEDVPLLVYEGPLRIEYWEDLVFSADQGVAVLKEGEFEVREDGITGIYLTSIRYMSEPQLVFPGIWRGISYWEERGLFLGIEESGEVVGFRGDGEVVFRTEVVSGEGVTIPAPKNYRFAIYNDQGVWLYDWEGKLIRQVMNRSVEEFLWGPEGRTFYMLVGEDHTLYVGDAYSGDLMIVDTDVDNLMLIG